MAIAPIGFLNALVVPQCGKTHGAPYHQPGGTGRSGGSGFAAVGGPTTPGAGPRVRAGCGFDDERTGIRRAVWGARDLVSRGSAQRATPFSRAFSLPAANGLDAGVRRLPVYARAGRGSCRGDFRFGCASVNTSIHFFHHEEHRDHEERHRFSPPLFPYFVLFVCSVVNPLLF